MSQTDDFVIDDGYTEQGYIAPVEGLHGALEFTFRPILPARRDAVARNDGEGFVTAAAKELAKAIKSWSASAGGKALPVTEHNIRSAKPRLFDRLWLVVAGYQPSDAKDAGIVNLEADAKN